MPKLHRLLLLLIIAICTLPMAVNAKNSASLIPGTNAESSPVQNTNYLTDDAPQEFLEVTEAYLLSTWVRDGNLIIHWDIEPGYYLYQEQFQLIRSDGTQLTPIFSSSIEKFDEYFEKNMAVHYGQATLTVALPASEAPFNLKIRSQGCADAGLCYPPYDDFLTIDPARELTESIDRETFEQHQAATATINKDSGMLMTALIFALLGGVILNLMPCVFPVLSIKVLSLTHADRSRLPLHGWAYTLGIVTCFVGFAAALLIAKAGGEAIGWGFQLQSPLLVAALAYLFLLMGLVLSGFLNFGNRWMGLGQNLTESDGLSGSFFTGILAAVVASPCTAPFMGVALGYALTQPAAAALAVFVALGLGMALPLLLLCYFPYFIQHLPQPGRWMDVLKQALAFPLYLTAVWLLWVLGRQLDSDAIALLMLGLVCFAFGLWLRQYRPEQPLWRGLILLTSTLSLCAALLIPYLGLTRQAEPSRWEAYSDQRLQELRDQGRPVFVNFTADWCITCLANERITLDTQEIEEAFERLDIATLKGDWTNRDPEITRVLESYSRSGVPLYLWFSPNSSGPGEILPQLLRKEHLREKFSPLTDK
ncbi:protein-disulfide reductase DsbD family protein [Gilvimarinus sp. 2_MG-2023]|uniref:protein-disulfide reductase DsbD family protein n=1 Tax=Gilvimarinus sp. 2_MG-2023 TaxID=3062666 RepID=UPI0026E29E9C|nr:protein-disulfide reductase DsbD domain-containing protein [Gilvimarinus sp. 2_MG-2023]MDO6570518.1 protein-disulfide reductase DsbD family protein [Gilvimarinus sp. 2_MG-2023]